MVIETEQHDTNLKHSDGKKHLDASVGPYFVKLLMV
jgi:hypothetical protein